MLLMLNTVLNVDPEMWSPEFIIYGLNIILVLLTVCAFVFSRLEGDDEEDEDELD